MSSGAEPRAGTRGASIARPIFLLVIASVLVATAISFVVTFSGPPPFDRPHSVRAIAMTLTGAFPPAFERAGPPPDARRGPFGSPGFGPLRRYGAATAPTARPGETPDAAARRRLAAELRTSPSRVLAFTGTASEAERDAFVGSFTFAWYDGGRWWVVQSRVQPFLTRWHVRTLLAMLAAILLLSLPSWLIVRALTRPLRLLARAADRAGTGAALPPLPGGSREVRDLARAVTTMHARLAHHAEARTAMLAGIAHDLGTPLSRLAFRVEQLPEDARARAAADIGEMRAMIAATLAFTRDEAMQTQADRLDLGSLLDSLVQDMVDAGQPVTLEAGPRAVVRGDTAALRRLFGNLIENAVRYGESATVGWQLEDGSVHVRVTDVGGGIDPAEAERLFQPFVRGDPSRNRATGGTGLGLAIVRSIATRHGGAATLENGRQGAVARVVLPLAG
ncbi:MAG: HAMP domain-containing sensor histidine kinase [Sphingomonas adhaesiva]|uniref:HAMP domain-containing sensor histidine kinase n=1 Tax=Sphingomonas adhaesiva TaxID=28212 RepID=UPI002FF6AAC9